MTPRLPRPVLSLFTLPLVLLVFATPRQAAAGPAGVLEQAAMESLAALQAGGIEPTHPFTTDGCSGGLSAAWQGSARLLPELAATLGGSPPWEGCCVSHDRAYWRGDTKDGAALRLAADNELRRCVVATGTERGAEFAARLDLSRAQVAEFFGVAGELMYAAVRAGGGPCTGLPWRWGYGWPHCLPGTAAGGP
ncbi:MAG: hypothetical protein P1P84_13735 [Deferrisomatales bacterium]|nr:hypothetical protein [Deferrisomatales bacterium]